MAKLSWGRCLILHADSENGEPVFPWGIIDTPKENSIKLESQQGSETRAVNEKGDVIDVRTSAATATLSFDLFVKKGEARPIAAREGIVEKEKAIRIVPFDNTCEGVQIDRCRMNIQESYSTDEGIMLHYTAKVLKPKEGNKVKPYEYTQEALRLVAGCMKLRAAGKTTFVSK